MSHCKASAVSTLGDYRGSVGSRLSQRWVIVLFQNPIPTFLARFTLSCIAPGLWSLDSGLCGVIHKFSLEPLP
jgi:hypothetical protein